MVNNNIFNSIDTTKSILMDRVLQNQNLLKLISIYDEDPLSHSDINDLSKIVDKSIFFKPKTLETQKDQMAFMCMGLSLLPNLDGNRVIDVFFTFTVYCHVDILDLCDGTSRAFKICAELNEMLTNTWGSWMGKIELEDGYEITEIPNSYYGINVRFSITDFAK